MATFFVKTDPKRLRTSAKRRAPRRLVVLTVVAALLWFGRAVPLGLLGTVLVVDQEQPGCTHIWIVGGDRCFDVAQQLHRENPSRNMLIVEGRPSRIQEMGILPTFGQICRDQLRERGISEKQIVTIRGQAENDWMAARELQQWMANHPDARLTLLCDRFKSRRRRLILDQVLSELQAARIAVRGLPDRRYDESNWWQMRSGVRELLGDGLSLGHVWWTGEGCGRPKRWDPDEYQCQLEPIACQS